MRFADLVATSAEVAARAGRLDKVGLLADLLGRLSPDEIEIAVAFLSGSPRQGRIGVGMSVIRAASSAPAAPSPSLELLEVDSTLARGDGVGRRIGGKQGGDPAPAVFARCRSRA
jgi:hypothetical protein